VLHAERATGASVRVVVILERCDRARLSALARARSLSSDVIAVHVETGEIESLRIRERWRRRPDGVRLRVLAPGVARHRITSYVRELAACGDGPLLVVVPTVVPRLRVLYPVVNWGGLRIARALAHRGVAVTTAPYPGRS
jgi:hypothetical protein